MGNSVNISEIELTEELAKGSFTTVSKAIWRNNTIVAKKYWTPKKLAKTFIKERYSQLLNIDHENLLKFYDILCPDNKHTILIMEYADCGSLYNYIYGSQGYTRMDALNWMLQCAEGISYLHAIKPTPIVHGNLKPQNLFLTNNYQTLKIGELGDHNLWGFKHFNDYEFIAYMAPEVAVHRCSSPQTSFSKLYTTSYDVYSYGTILWEVFLKRKPFRIAKPVFQFWGFPDIFKFQHFETIDYYNSFNIWLSDITDELSEGQIRSLIVSCWRREPNKRPSISTVALNIRIFKNTNPSLELDSIAGHFDPVTIKKELGKGSYGVVHEASIYGVEYAVKSYFKENSDSIKELEREINHLSRMDHESIVKLFGTTQHEVHKTLIIMEYADCGTLYNYIHCDGKQKRDYTYLAALNWMHQLAQGMEYLHGMKPKPVIHRDLKSKNLLLSNNFRKLKIADFGTVTELATIMTKSIGTCAYMAPEIAEDGKKYSEKSDVYSFGILLWEVMSGKKPFYHLKNNQPLTIMFVTTQGKRPPLEDVRNYPNSSHIKTLINNCWDMDSEVRPSMKEIAFVLGIDFENSDFNMLKIKPLPETTDLDYQISRGDYSESNRYSNQSQEELRSIDSTF